MSLAKARLEEAERKIYKSAAKREHGMSNGLFSYDVIDPKTSKK